MWCLTDFVAHLDGHMAGDLRGRFRLVGRAPLPSKTAHSLCAVSSPASVGHLFVTAQNPMTVPRISHHCFFLVTYLSCIVGNTRLQRCLVLSVFRDGLLMCHLAYLTVPGYLNTNLDVVNTFLDVNKVHNQLTLGRISLIIWVHLIQSV